VNQSAFMTASLLAGFVLFLAARNRLGAYTAVLWGPTSAPASGGGSEPSTSDKVKDAAETAGDIWALLNS